MIATLLAVLAKDFRLLLRDHVGLVFLTIAPIVVITVAGFSLASLYGADPRGATAYLLPVADEDGGSIGRAIRERLANETAVSLRPVSGRDEARRLIEARDAGVGLVIPQGTSDAVAAGRPAKLVMLTDPVKYLEIASIRNLVQELRHGLETEARRRAAARLESMVPASGLPGEIAIEETSVTGAPRRLNTFDQNVPGFSVTFLLLGMLFGVSLGLLDERDWGTLDRVRATPTPVGIFLFAKILCRLTVGMVQMGLL
ncbi:MAG: ABC transporter permease, partial [Candidatus Binatia bacterium]